MRELWYNRKGTDVTWSVVEGTEVQIRLSEDSNYTLVEGPEPPASSILPDPVSITSQHPAAQRPLAKPVLIK